MKAVKSGNVESVILESFR